MVLTRIAAFLLLPALASSPAWADATSVAALPESLAAWYKPVNKRQVWLHTMFALRRELQAVEEYAAQGDVAHLRKWAEALLQHYREIPAMVPEWREHTDPGTAADLEQAVTVGDAEAAAAAAERLGGSCRACHRKYRALAAARYRSPDFSGVRVVARDGGEIDYDEAMEALSRSLNRIKIAAEDERWDSAGNAAARLGDQLQRLGKSCTACHADSEPRERIVGAATRATLDRLNQALSERDAKTAGRTLGEAAVQVCARCHGVHRTLAELRDQLFK